MKPGATDHPKMLRLAAELGCQRYGAVGVVECLFHYCDRYTPRGDVFRFGWLPICTAVGWKPLEAEAARLLRALEAAGWLDAHPLHTYVVHDWPDHCPDYRKRKVKASGEGWAVDDSGAEEPPTHKAPENSGLPILSDPIRSDPIQSKPTQPSRSAGSRRKPALVDRPEDWPTTDEKQKLAKWWRGKGGNPRELGRALERFTIQSDSKGYRYKGRRGWYAAFQGAVMDGWALAEGVRHKVSGEVRPPRGPVGPGFDHAAAEAEVAQEWRVHASHHAPEPGCGLCTVASRREKRAGSPEPPPAAGEASETDPGHPSEP